MSRPDELMLETDRFSIVRVTRRLPDGRTKRREVIRHPGSVVILPLLEQDRVCLIENHRIAVGHVLVELPAGTLDSGEAPRDCAHRELIEETGYRAERLEQLSCFYAAPGILDERMYLFAAYGLTAGEPAREADEEIQNRVVSWTDALNMIDRGEIQDAKTIIGLLLYHTKHRTSRWEGNDA